MTELTLAALFLVGSHMGLSHGAIRRGLVGKLGLWPHRLVYSLISIVAMAWLVLAYKDAPFQVVFEATIRLQHMALSMMLAATLLIVGGYTIANPSAVILEDLESRGPLSGTLKITRAPVMWGVAIFAFAHMLANPDAGSLIFFGALLVLAIAGGWHLDRRKQAEGGEVWQKLCAQTSFWPLKAIVLRRTKLSGADLSWWRLAVGLGLYGGLLFAHKLIIGVTAFPLPL